jgi:CDP-diacylglycerol---glycerol-3-phosphate 3-phosphatidyltransferase
MEFRQLPNSLSAVRIVAAPIMMVLLLIPWDASYIAALGVFIIASISDTLDGYMARRQKLVSNLGIFLDLTADKIFVSVILIAMVETHLLPSWLVATIVAREFIVTGLRTYAAAEGVVVPAGKWGKRKTAITVLAVALLILYGDILRGGWTARLIADPAIANWFVVSVWLMYLAMVITVISGLQYLFSVLPLLRPKDNTAPANWHE